MKVLFVAILLLSLYISSSHKYGCIFDKVNRDVTNQSSKTKRDEGINANRESRLLLSITRNPIRITFDTTSFINITIGVNGANTTTRTNLNFVLRAMMIVQKFYINRLKVYPVTRIFAPTTCFDHLTTINDQVSGIAGSDLHIYVLYLTDMATTYAATGKSCKYYGDLTSTLPDTTLQAGRPTMGRIIFNTFKLVDGQTLTNRLFQAIASTAVHETIHILGFDSTLYQYFLDPQSGLAYTTPVISNSNTVNMLRPLTNLLATPFVLSWAKTFFACPSLNGMLLQNEDGGGGGGGSHWERLAMYDQLMTATAYGGFKGMSGLTFAILKDMGWYTVDDTFYQTTNYGYQLGCSFVLDACYSITSFPIFCNSATQSAISTCQTTFYGKAVCSSQAALLADGCGLYFPYFNCIDPTSSDDGYKLYTLEVYGTNSFCVTGTIGTISLPVTVISRCYPYVCGISSIIFTIGTNTITCLSSQMGAHKTLSSFTGHLVCPVFADFCTNSRKTCINWCSQNGYCTRGICNCYTGYAGNDCSQTICTVANTYYNPATTTCLSTCPSGTYQNAYSLACESCATTCQQCFGQPHICTGCRSTIANPQYFYNATCYSACPIGTYQQGFNCLDCNVTVNCKSCFLSATNCTSCLNNLFLSTPVFGTCIVSCSGIYILHDLVNYLCTSSCNVNLVLSGNTCIMCSEGTFKDVNSGICVATCLSMHYPDSVLRVCAQCDASCLNCNGPYVDNCTACIISSSLKYLLLKICWPACPSGFYAQNTTGQCQLCTHALNCASCILRANLTVQCLTCNNGHYYLSSQCNPTCPTGMFTNTWNNSCAACSSSCVNCTASDSSACVSCNAITHKLLINVTGGYCIVSCPIVGYFTSGTNCLTCHATCRTCSGMGTNQCLSCTTGLYLNSGFCRYVCPTTTYPDTSTNNCLSCNGSCTYCFASTIDNCTGCITGLVLFNFTCTDRCPNGLTVNQWKVCYSQYISFVGVVMMLVIVFFV